jgi:hypothetical protein
MRAPTDLTASMSWSKSVVMWERTGRSFSRGCRKHRRVVDGGLFWTALTKYSKSKVSHW